MKPEDINFAKLTASEEETLKNFELEFFRETGKKLCLLAVEKQA